MRGHRSAAAGALLLTLAVTGPAPAQERPGSRGWLGVGVQELLECRVDISERERCRKRLVVTQVVVDGPADRAGVRAGDTLVALGGDRLDRGLEAAAFAALRPGAPVRVEVGRRDGRTALRVVPGERPTGPLAVRGPGGPGAPRSLGRPLAPTATPPTEPPPARGRIVIRGEAGGLYRIEPSVEIRLEGADGVALQGPSEELAEAAPSTREELERALRETVRSGTFASPEVTPWVRLELGPELRARQDSVFRVARLHLDSLQRALRGNEDRHREFLERRRAAVPGQLAWVAGFGRGVAGAEFEPLSPELAEFFQGTEDGLLCLRVVSDTPADRLGLRPGDVVVEVAGRPVAGLDELRDAFRHPSARAISVKWIRKGQPMEGVLRY